MKAPSSSSSTNLHAMPPQQASSQSRANPNASNTDKEEKKTADGDHEFIMKSTNKIIELADLRPKSDTADLIQRSVRQHVEYQRRINILQSSNKESLSKQDDANRKIMNYIEQLTELENRENALSALSKLRENNPDLAPLLWGTPAVIAALIQEVISVYPYLSGNIEMNSNHSNRCCNALALLQCVASHPETRGLFLKAYIPLFLYPFLNTELNSRPFEYLRLTSLGVIGALVKHPHPNVIPKYSIIAESEVTEFLVKTEAIPLCLHIMEYGNELSQTVATFIIQKILLDDYGLNYVCKTSDRFFAISQVLTKMIADPVKKPSKKLIKHVVRCYLRLCDDKRALCALHTVLPKYLQTEEAANLIGDDDLCLTWLKQLRHKYAQSLQAQQEESAKRHHLHHAHHHASSSSSHAHHQHRSNSSSKTASIPAQSQHAAPHHAHQQQMNNLSSAQQQMLMGQQMAANINGLQSTQTHQASGGGSMYAAPPNAQLTNPYGHHNSNSNISVHSYNSGTSHNQAPAYNQPPSSQTQQFAQSNTSNSMQSQHRMNYMQR